MFCTPLLAPSGVRGAVFLRLPVARSGVTQGSLQSTLGAVRIQVFPPTASWWKKRSSARCAQCEAAGLRTRKEQLDCQCADQSIATQLHLRNSVTPFELWPHPS